jgi:hypothetical protein
VVVVTGKAELSSTRSLSWGVQNLLLTLALVICLWPRSYSHAYPEQVHCHSQSPPRFYQQSISMHRSSLSCEEQHGCSHCPSALPSVGQTKCNRW